MTAPRALCLCIDDVGLHEGVNEAAQVLRRAGRVHALSCMVGGPAWPSGAAGLRRDTVGPVDIGLHLDLTAWPLTLAPASWSAVWWRGTLDRLPAAGLRDEVVAQLDRFEDHLGRAPDFVDGHQHVHQFPQVRDALVDVLVKRYPYRRPWLRSTRAAGWGFKPRLLERLGARALMADAELLAFPGNRRLLGVYDFLGGPSRYATLMADWLRQARHGDLLMCHPSVQAVPGDPIRQARLDEYAVLASPAFGELIAAEGIRLDAMSRLLQDERFAAAGAGW
ncbi:ChbG/HpnK family deacetylase [Mitsuaria sp. GD03876]|uniref:ChbG/HpnK family deacetylase n=1 Tax=Mitsuaria sp. GD03876 TaxID=2975399 RepID=UPI00244D05AC|nr:ChbG/HpnK family deacetylase [Mitsuaria sp. GD03876]MDH0864618.1 ChbG/HpnK family deacetylase [Mitsuaria sp. GD03876]